MQSDNNSTAKSYDDLIDHTLVVAAKEKLATAIARRATAQSNLIAAQDTHAAAKRSYDAALLGEGDAHTARQAMDDAACRLAIAHDAGPAVEAAIKLADRDLQTATGRAAQPVHDQAVSDMLASCREADSARAALAGAEQLFRAAAAAFSAAVRDGADPSFRGQGVDAGSPSLTGPDAIWKHPTEAEMHKRLGKPAA